MWDSGRLDSNQRPLDPQSNALTKLRYAPKTTNILIQTVPHNKLFLCPGLTSFRISL